MNRIFSFKRYAWLMKCQFVENKRLYLWGIGGMLAVIALFFWSFSAMKFNGRHVFYQEAILINSAYICLMFFAGTFFERFGKKAKRIFYFSLPASPLERLAVAFSYVMVLCPIAFILLFYVVDFFALQIFNSVNGTDNSMMLIFTYSWEILYRMILMISVFALGSFIFGTAGIIKTILVTVAFLMLHIGLYTLIFSCFFNIKHPCINLPYVSIIVDGVTLKASNIFSYSWFLIAPVCWVIYFFKLKEKEA